MVATLHSEMGIAHVGEALKYVMGPARMQQGEPKISYAQLAQMMEIKGFKDPKTQLPIDKSRVTSYAADRALAPLWFLQAVAQLLSLPERWWESDISPDKPQHQADSDIIAVARIVVAKVPPIKQKGIRETYPLSKRSDWPDSMRIPAWLKADTVIAVPVGDSTDSMPCFEPASVNLVNVAKCTLSIDKIYAITLPDGSGEYRMAVWEDDNLILRSARRRRPDIIATADTGVEPTFYVDGLVVANFPAYDDSIPDFEVKYFKTSGIEIPDWVSK